MAQVAGASGGADEAVVDGRTGLVVRRPRSVADATGALRSLLQDRDRREAMGREARARATTEFSYDALARRLGAALAEVGG